MSSPEPVFQYRENGFIRYVLNGFLLCLTLSFITGCDFAQNKRQKTAIAPPPFSKEKPISREQSKQIAKSVNPQEGMSIKQVSINNKEIEKPEKIVTAGFKKDILFENQGLTAEERIARLESAVQKISDKFIKIDPTIKRLAEVDNDLSLLTNQLEILVSQDGQRDFKRKKPQEFQNVKMEPSKQPKVKQNKPEVLNEILPASGDAKIDILSIRMNDHPNKTRIVFDTNQRIQTNAMIEGENALRVKLSHVIDLSNTIIRQNSNLIQDIQIDERDNALLFIVGRGIKDISGDHIAPSENVPHYRFYVDLK